MASRQSRKAPEKRRSGTGNVTGNVTGQADNSSESGEALSPDELARALRAMAAELERDPALARRVAGAMRMPADATSSPDSVPSDTTDDAVDDTPTAPVKRGSRTFKPRLVTGAAPALGPGVPDPFALREQLGEDGLRALLADLRLGTLRAIVREHHLDPKGALAGQNDDAKFRALILRATKRARRD